MIINVFTLFEKNKYLKGFVIKFFLYNVIFCEQIKHLEFFSNWTKCFETLFVLQKSEKFVKT